MRMPGLHGTIARRLLIDHLVDPSLARTLVPEPFDLRLVEDRAVLGMCLIRIDELRPNGVPRVLGSTIEAVAHRISVTTPGPDGPVHGVYVPRRDTTSLPAVALGGRLFPGVHGRAAIAASDASASGSPAGDTITVRARCADECDIDVAVGTAVEPDDRSQQLSDLHRSELVAWSPRRNGGAHDVAIMTCHRWVTTPVSVDRASSSWLADLPGLDGNLHGPSALLMRGIAVTWETGVRHEFGPRSRVDREEVVSAAPA